MAVGTHRNLQFPPVIHFVFDYSYHENSFTINSKKEVQVVPFRIHSNNFKLPWNDNIKKLLYKISWIYFKVQPCLVPIFFWVLLPGMLICGRFKRENTVSEEKCVSRLIGSNYLFNCEMEPIGALLHNILNLEDMWQALALLEIRKLAFEVPEEMNIKQLSSNVK